MHKNKFVLYYTNTHMQNIMNIFLLKPITQHSLSHQLVSIIIHAPPSYKLQDDPLGSHIIIHIFKMFIGLCVGNCITFYCLVNEVFGIGEGFSFRPFQILRHIPRPIGQRQVSKNLKGPKGKTFSCTKNQSYFRFLSVTFFFFLS